MLRRSPPHPVLRGFPPSLWVKIFKPQRVCVWVCCCVQHFGWVPPGLTCFLQCILLGLLWAPQFFQWVPLAVLWAPRLCLTICGGLHMGSYWAPVFLQVCAMGSVWWLLGPHGLLLGSCIFAGVCSGLPHGLLLGARVFAATCSGLPHGLLLGSCVFSNYLWWAPAWAPFGLLYFCRYLRWAPAWAPSGLLCFAGHGVLAAKNTIVGFEIRKFPVFLQLWS